MVIEHSSDQGALSLAYLKQRNGVANEYAWTNKPYYMLEKGVELSVAY